MNQTKPADAPELVIEVKHTGERLSLRRIQTDADGEQLLLHGTLPARQQGPPLHIHFHEDECGQVLAGSAMTLVDGVTGEVRTGESAKFPKGSSHRWWNDGDELLEISGTVSPVVDLDRYLQAVFEVLNAGTRDRPPIFYMAHVLYRHRKTQTVLILPRAVQWFALPLIVLLGTALGKYRGTSWPGCPARCTGAPVS